MNWLDAGLLLMLLFSILAGLRAGLIQTGIGFAASIAGLVLGLNYYHVLGLRLRDYIPQRGLSSAVGFAIIFCGIALAGAVVSGILLRLVREAHLGGADRLLGGAFGVIRGLFFATIAILALMAFLPATQRPVLAQSRLAPYVMDAARHMADASPDEVKQSFRESYRELNKVLPENIRERLSKVPPGQI
jgi:membrane protein required for colicin V production